MDSGLPVEVDDLETILRGIKTRYHVTKSNKLKPHAFRPPPGADDLSAMRHGFLGTEWCRAKSIEICKSEYIGMATIGAGKVREIGSNVIDTREEFLGHVDIRHGFILPKDEPPEQPELKLRLDRRCQALANAARLYIDPSRDADQWQGEKIS